MTFLELSNLPLRLSSAVSTAGRKMKFVKKKQMIFCCHFYSTQNKKEKH